MLHFDVRRIYRYSVCDLCSLLDFFFYCMRSLCTDTTDITLPTWIYRILLLRKLSRMCRGVNILSDVLLNVHDAIYNCFV
jgi:hypothetical protein